MGLCSLRGFCLANFIIQLLFTAIRQVFDFLGYMWGPVLANFFQIIFVIFGFFGVYQYRLKYVVAYTVWCVIWCGWNVFVTCFYLNAFGLDKDSDLLNLGTGCVSWWESNGPGCKPQFLANHSSLELPPWRPPRPDTVTGCLLLYHHLEAAQALLHLLLASIGLISSVAFTCSLVDEDDTFDFMGGLESKSPQHLALQPLYVRRASGHSHTDSLLTSTLSRGWQRHHGGTSTFTSTSTTKQTLTY